jgi:hypothetical protein
LFPCICKPLKGVQHSTLACNVYYVHYIIHGTKGLTFFYGVLGKLRFVVCVYIVSVMLSDPHVERSTSLSNILFVACRARQLIYSSLVKFVWFLGFLHFQEFSQVIVSGIQVCHFQRCVYETFCDVSSLSSDVCELDPSLVSVFLMIVI